MYKLCLKIDRTSIIEIICPDNDSPRVLYIISIIG